MNNRILQFGTSRFLQAHVDLFVHEAREAGQDIGPITVVKTTNSPEREQRVVAFQNPLGFPVRLQGSQAGTVVDHVTQVRSVCRALEAVNQWQDIKNIFAHETEIVVSNVGERGYELSVQSNSTNVVPISFPEKLLALLVYRFEHGALPLLILPCELVSQNGVVLRGILEDLAEQRNLPSNFRTWLAQDVMICDTLVDRIVSEAIEPVGAIGEPYGLWAIKRQPGFVPPFTHPCVVYTDDLEPYLRLKLHILNLGHSYLAQVWKSEMRPDGEKVREILADAGVKDRLLSLYRDEVIIGFSAHSMKTEAENYVASVLERFENPFLNHRISDIAQNHAAKIERRVRDFIVWAKAKDAGLHLPRLEELSNVSA